MKNNRKKIILLICLLFTAGCESKSSSKTLTCTSHATVAEGVDVEVKYQVKYHDLYVSEVQTEEKIKASQEYLEAYQKSMQESYDPYQKLSYYDYDSKIKNGTLISTIKINYEKIDVDKLIEIDSSNADLFQDGKVYLKTIRDIYEGLGATCRE